MSYEISLIDSLRNKNVIIFERLSHIKELAKPLLSYTCSKFPYYTPHDFTHSENVEENINWIIPENQKIMMDQYETFFLLIAAWLHDWGMVAENHEIADHIRDNHHIRTENYFEKHYNKLTLNEHEARIIGRICKGHRKVDLSDKEYDDVIFAQNHKIRVRFLSALLRLADECDITHNRTPEIIYCSINPEGKSEEEFKKHLSITGVGQLDAKHKIYISAIAKDPKGAKTLREVAQKIQFELNTVKAVLAKEGIILDTIDLRLETRGFIDKPIGFEIDKTKILTLLIGQHLYSQSDVAIRELIQNSIDSCKLLEINSKDYNPKILIRRLHDNTLNIEDNGIGMRLS